MSRRKLSRLLRGESVPNPPEGLAERIKAEIPESLEVHPGLASPQAGTASRSWRVLRVAAVLAPVLLAGLLSWHLRTTGPSPETLTRVEPQRPAPPSPTSEVPTPLASPQQAQATPAPQVTPASQRQEPAQAAQPPSRAATGKEGRALSMLHGTVLDVTGAVIPEVTVTAVDPETGNGVSTQTDAAGSFALERLPAGRYTMTMAAPGFGTGVVEGIDLASGGDREIDVLLQPGDSKEEITVTADLVPVELVSAEVAGAMTEEIVVTGEDADDYMAGEYEEEFLRRTISQSATLLPGVTGTKAQEEKAAPKRSWKRVAAAPNTSRLMIGDDEALPLRGMQVEVHVDGFRARVVLDCFFFNDRSETLEGDFKLRLPDDAALYYFAFGKTSAEYSLKDLPDLKAEFLDPAGAGDLSPEEVRQTRQQRWSEIQEARMVPRQQAAFAYERTVRRRVDPALVEWAGAGVFSAKVFPLTPHTLHRVVVGYDVFLRPVEDTLELALPLPAERGETRVDLSIAGDVRGEARVEPRLAATFADGRTHYVVENPQAGELRLFLPHTRPLWLLGGNDAGGRFWATQVVAELPARRSRESTRAVFLLDTSLSSRPGTFNLWLALLRHILDDNRGSLRQFAVLTFDVGQHWWRQQWSDNTEENVAALLKDCEQLALEGATDLHQALASLGAAEWLRRDGHTRTDLFLLSDGAATWGETDLPLLDRAVSEAPVDSLYAYQTGMAGSAISVLQRLARQHGGAVLSVASEAELAVAAVAHRLRPWRLTSVEADGADDVLTAGRALWVYPGQRLTVVGRGLPQGRLQLHLDQDGHSRTLTYKVDKPLSSELTPRLYGQVAVSQLEELGGATEEYAAAYARHFRVTGRTCSLLMLDSEDDYQRYDIKPEDDRYVVQTSRVETLMKTAAAASEQQLGDSKQRLVAWLERLEHVPGLELELSTALKLALTRLEVEPVSAGLEYRLRQRADWPKGYEQALAGESVDYDAVVAEVERRQRTLGPGDAVRALSNLVEGDPGNLVLVRDVAATAMDLGAPDQAYPLLLRVAQARPYQGFGYTDLADCLQRMGRTDLAMVLYEVAVSGDFEASHEDFHQIAATEYLSLLNRVADGRLPSQLRDYARSRRAVLAEEAEPLEADLLVVLQWNTDRTDVDLHVVEPSGEECYYGHARTAAGGQISEDVTDGFGPEMYWIPKAPKGKFTVKVDYYADDQLRAGVRSKVYLTIYRSYGRPDEQVEHRTVQLSGAKDMQEVAALSFKDQPGALPTTLPQPRPIEQARATARLFGNVTDRQGTAVPGAKVEAFNHATNETMSTTTTPQGSFVLDGLSSGSYALLVEAHGFAAGVVEDIRLAEAGNRRLDVRLQSGEITEEITVTADMVPVELVGAEVAGLVSGAGVRKVPLNGRDIAQLAMVQPGFDQRYASPPPVDREQYELLSENEFHQTADDPLSTFSVDVDTASYANLRRMILNGRWPPLDAVRIEELVNYFSYDYLEPAGEHPIAVATEVTSCPWAPTHRLVRLGLKTRAIDWAQRPRTNLVFLLDVSGSMDSPFKLDLVKKAMRLLLDNLGENDQVAIVVYAGAAGLVLPPTRCDDKERILEALEQLEAGGSTAGGQGIQLAYRVAQENYIPGGLNRVILCTDGDFNVGVTDQGALVRLVQDRAKHGVFLTVLGFGMGNLQDSTLEKLADKGNGSYGYVDSELEARKLLVAEIGGTLLTVAKDVKIQVELNPSQVAAYRLIGYENRILAHQDFNDDRKDAGEIGAGHTVTALYEIVPAGVETTGKRVDELRYQQATKPSREAASDELLFVKVRYKYPDEDASRLMTAAVVDEGRPLEDASADTRFAAAVATFGLVLRESEHKGDASLDMALELASQSLGEDAQGYREGFLELVRAARRIEE